MRRVTTCHTHCEKFRTRGVLVSCETDDSIEFVVTHWSLTRDLHRAAVAAFTGESCEAPLFRKLPTRSFRKAQIASKPVCTGATWKCIKDSNINSCEFANVPNYPQWIISVRLINDRVTSNQQQGSNYTRRMELDGSQYNYHCAPAGINIKQYHREGVTVEIKTVSRRNKNN